MSTRVVSLLIAFAWTIATADAQPVGHQPAEQAAVLAAFDRYLEAVSANAALMPFQSLAPTS